MSQICTHCIKGLLTIVILQLEKMGEKEYEKKKKLNFIIVSIQMKQTNNNSENNSEESHIKLKWNFS